MKGKLNFRTFLLFVAQPDCYQQVYIKAAQVNLVRPQSALVEPEEEEEEQEEE